MRKHRIENVGGVCGCEGSGLMLDLVGGKGGLWVGGGLVDQSGRLANVHSKVCMWICRFELGSLFITSGFRWSGI